MFKIKSMVFVVFALFALASSQTCSIPTNNQAYDNSGFIVTLYSITSAAACCTACSGFKESKSYAWATDGSLRCTCTNANSQSVSSSNSMGGVITSGYARPQVTCSSDLEVGLDYNNGAIGPINTYQTAAECCAACQTYIGCNYYGFATWGSCYMRASNANPTANTYLTSGAVVGPAPAALRSGKRGIAWTASYSCTDLEAMTNIAWIYNWGPQPDAPLLQCMQALGIQYFPMIWGIGSNWPISYLSTSSTHLLTFNEPNFSSQSALTPSQAAAAWPQIQAFAQQYNMLISAPSASTGGDLMDPIVWLDQFFAACQGCQIDFITTHIYTCYSVVPVLSQFTKYGLPIWVTEFSCPNIQNSSVVQPFMRDALSYMDGNPQFERYSWFGTRLNDDWLGPGTSLFNNNGAGLSPLGQFYNTPSSSSASISASTAASASASTSGTASLSSSASISMLASTSKASATSASASTSLIASTSSSTSASVSVSSAVTASVSASAASSTSAITSTSSISSVAATSASSVAKASVSAASSLASTSSSKLAASTSASSAASTSASASASASLASVASTSASTSASASLTLSASTSGSVLVASTSSAASTAAVSTLSSASTVGSSTTKPSTTYPPAPGVPTIASTAAPTTRYATTVIPTTVVITTLPPTPFQITTAAPTTNRITSPPVTTRPSTTIRATTAAPTTASKSTTPTSTTVKPVTTSPATTRAQTTPVPTTTASPTTSKASVPATNPPSPCGSAPACGTQCYDASMYSCSSGVLCPLGMQSCSGACYSSSQYKCVSGSLVQV